MVPATCIRVLFSVLIVFTCHYYAQLKSAQQQNKFKMTCVYKNVSGSVDDEQSAYLQDIATIFCFTDNTITHAVSISTF